MIYVSTVLGSFLWFSFIYLFFSFTIEKLLNKKAVFDNQVKYIDNQRKFELKYTFLSIFIFSLGSVVLVEFYKIGRILTENPTLLEFITEASILIIFNELHFYVVHFTLHKTSLKKYHLIHHRLKNPTAFSSYALHPVESSMLGSVMPIILLFGSFHYQSLLFLTIWSLVINCISHTNKNLRLKFLTEHQQHHSYYNGNYAFTFSFLDKILKQEVKPKI